MSLQCETHPRSQGGITVVLTGRLDSATASEFDRTVDHAMEELTAGMPLVLDFGRLTYISSMGIRSLLRARKALQMQGGSVSMIHMQPQVASVLQMANLYF